MAIGWVLAMAMVGAVPGTPEPVKPIPQVPQLYGRWYDDDLGYRRNRPHYRTWELTAGLRIEHVVIAIDHATLDGQDPNVRIDDLSALIGWTDQVAGAWYCVGAGGRARGSYGGATIQLRGHQLWDNGYSPTDYERGIADVGFAFLNAGWLGWSPTWTAARLRAGIETTLSGEVVTDGQLLSAIKLRAIGAAGPVSGWLGIVHNEHAGRRSDSHAEQSVLEHEEGLAVIGGVSLWWLSYAVAWLPRAEIAGALSLEFEW